jgi:hypothetical protein
MSEWGLKWKLAQNEGIKSRFGCPCLPGRIEQTADQNQYDGYQHRVNSFLDALWAASLLQVGSVKQTQEPEPAVIKAYGKPSVPYTYAAAVFLLRFPLDSALSAGTVSVHAAGIDWR